MEGRVQRDHGGQAAMLSWSQGYVREEMISGAEGKLLWHQTYTQSAHVVWAQGSARHWITGADSLQADLAAEEPQLERKALQACSGLAFPLVCYVPGPLWAYQRSVSPQKCTLAFKTMHLCIWRGRKLNPGYLIECFLVVGPQGL